MDGWIEEMDKEKFIKVFLRQEHIWVWGLRTMLMKGFDPLQMLTSLKKNHCIKHTKLKDENTGNL